MADAQLITFNAANSAWVDSVPGGYTTGYSHQNTHIESRNIGQDFSYVTTDGTNIYVEISGYVDNKGEPIKTPAQVTLTPTANTYGIWYIYIVPDGITTGYFDYGLTQTVPTWDATKNAYYGSISGTSRRFLSWVAHWTEDSDLRRVSRIEAPTGTKEITRHPYEYTVTKDMNILFWGTTRKYWELDSSSWNFNCFTYDYTSPDQLIFYDITNNLYKTTYGVSGSYSGTNFARLLAKEVNIPLVLGFDGSNLISYNDTDNLIHIHTGVAQAITKSLTPPAGSGDILAITGFPGCQHGTQRLLIARTSAWSGGGTTSIQILDVSGGDGTTAVLDQTITTFAQTWTGAATGQATGQLVFDFNRLYLWYFGAPTSNGVWSMFWDGSQYQIQVSSLDSITRTSPPITPSSPVVGRAWAYNATTGGLIWGLTGTSNNYVGINEHY